MKLRIAIRGLCAALAVVALTYGPVRAADSLPLDRFRDYLDSLRVQSSIPGLSAAIVGPNDVIWAKEFGQQNVERSVATRTDTPFQLDALTQVFTATLALRCVEEGRLSLDDRVGQFRPNSADANLTIRQLLTHTTGSTDNPTFSYRPDRLSSMWNVIRVCTGDSYRETLANTLDRLAMVNSVPGLDIVSPNLSEGVPTADAVSHYAAVLDRLATPYAVDPAGKAIVSSYSATALTPSTGLISTVRDYAQFDLALKSGLLVRADTLAQMWLRPSAKLPHGVGWFVQTYNGELIVWQFGMSDNASSSLTITVPGRGLTLILLANSNGLVKPFDLGAGDVTVSPYAKLFLGTFVR